MNQRDIPIFPGVNPPSTDFASVRDGRRARVFWYDVDLTNARSIAAGTALILPIAGNSFFSDQSPLQGNATVYFQDFTLTPTDAPPIYIGPGFVGSVPFTTMLIENTAQPGKRLRFFYGVDVDFRPNLSGALAISGAVNSVPYGYQPGVVYKSSTALAALTPETVFSPGSNLNGATVWACQAVTSAGAAQNIGAFVAKNAAPASLIDGNPIYYANATGAGNYSVPFALPNPVTIPPGQGLYYLAQLLEAGPVARFCAYSFL